MTSDVILRLTGKQKSLLMAHLFPGDGFEAAALLLCGRRRGSERHCLSVMEVIAIPYESCERTADYITWPTAILMPLIQRASKDGLAIVKVHSHPGGFSRFSRVDDVSDKQFFETLSVWTESSEPNASVVVLPDGNMFGRYGDEANRFCPLDMISVAGETVEYWSNDVEQYVPDFADRHAQVLGEATFGKLRRIRCAVVGCSGTGSPVVEQLFRLGVGELVLVDPDRIGPENLNRIINSRSRHAQQRTLKVELTAQAIEETGLGTTIIALARDLCASEAIEMVATCDVVFGCVDSIYARHVLNKLASTYCIPYFDVGVGIRADGKGGISDASIAVHYLQPDGSSLLSRQVFTLDRVQAEILQRTDPKEFAAREAVGYIHGAEVSRPAVMPINTIVAGYGVFEFLCRVHNLRDESNVGFASQRWSLSGSFVARDSDGERCGVVSRNLGRGDMRPLLGMPELSKVEEVHRVHT